jgi:predicted Rossmann fold flavoprotein
VLLLESARKPGAKILVSGGSRCNVTNVRVDDADFWGGRRSIIRRILRSFPIPDTIAFFRELGIALHEEPDGKLFPDSNRARDVLEALLGEAARAGVELRCATRVTAVRRANDGFDADIAGDTIHARAVVLATGGLSLPKSGSDGAGLQVAAALGHTIVPTTPGLAPLILDPAWRFPFRSLSGVSHDAELGVTSEARTIERLRGALLWTHFGISGPVALNASRVVLRARLEGHDARLVANLLPEDDFERVEAAFVRSARQRPASTAGALLTSRLPASVASAVADYAGVETATPLARWTRDDRRRLVHTLTALEVPVVDSRGYNYAEVTAGGIALDEIDPATMESRKIPGLFLVGEMLDVDGRIGGFNFQWAWATGKSAARGLTRR